MRKFTFIFLALALAIAIVSPVMAGTTYTMDEVSSQVSSNVVYVADFGETQGGYSLLRIIMPGEDIDSIRFGDGDGPDGIGTYEIRFADLAYPVIVTSDILLLEKL